MKRKITFGGLALVLAVVIIGALVVLVRSTRARGLALAHVQGPGQGPGQVSLPEARRVALPATTAVGVLLPPQTVNIASRQSGKVVDVVAEVGRAVRAGDILVRLDDTIVRHELAMARASIRAAQAVTSGAGAELASARERSVRRKGTVEVGGKTLSVVSGEELSLAKRDEQSAASRAASAGANAAVAQARAQQLEAELDALTLRAPFDGVVSARYADPGAFAGPGEPLVRLLGSGSLRVRFAVPEDDGGSVIVGRRVEMRIEERPAFATVDRISPEVEASSRTFFVEAVVDAGVCAGALGWGGGAKAGTEGTACAALAGRVVRVSL